MTVTQRLQMEEEQKQKLFAEFEALQDGVVELGKLDEKEAEILQNFSIESQCIDYDSEYDETNNEG